MPDDLRRPRQRLPSFSGRPGEPRAASDPDQVQRDIELRAFASEVRLQHGYLVERVAALEEEMAAIARADAESTRVRLQEMRDRERARSEAEKAAAEATQKERDRRRYEIFKAVALLLVGAAVTLFGAWAKARAGW